MLIAIAAAAACARREPPKTEERLSAALRGAVDVRQPGFAASDGDRGRDVWTEEQRFYRENGYQLAWSDGRRLRGEFDRLLRALGTADQEGLDPAEYHAADLEAARSGLARERAIELDLRASSAYLRYARDLTHGTVDPEDVDPQWHATPRNVDLHNALRSAIGAGNVEQTLHALAPASPQYQGLKHQLALAWSLFNRVERDFSDGCVRVDDPEALARYVLRDQPEWTPERIAAAMQSGTEQAVKLKEPLPISLGYFTAWEEGALKTVPDVYGLDRRHDAVNGQ